MKINKRLIAAVCGLGLSFAAGYTLHSPPVHSCQEDEVYAVQLDADPSHGLTWACENVQQYVERITD